MHIASRHACLVVVGALLAASPTLADGELPRVLVLDLSHSDTIDNGTAKILDELLAVEVSRLPGYDVLSGADVRRLVELEAEKQAVGCTDDASCLAEIAGAMGAQYVISGSVGKLGTRFILTLTLFDSRAARSVSRVDLRAASIDEIADGLASKVKELMGALEVTSAPSEKPPVTIVDETLEDGTKVHAAVKPDEKTVTVSATGESELSFLGIGTTAGVACLGLSGCVLGGVFDLSWFLVEIGTTGRAIFDPLDFVGPAIALGGLATLITAGVLVPFLWWDEPEEDDVVPPTPVGEGP